MPVDNEWGTQEGSNFRLKKRVYQSPDGKGPVWSTPQHGVARLVGTVGTNISMDEARKLKIAPPARKRKQKAPQSNKSKTTKKK